MACRNILDFQGNEDATPVIRLNPAELSGLLESRSRAVDMQVDVVGRMLSSSAGAICKAV